MLSAGVSCAVGPSPYGRCKKRSGTVLVMTVLLMVVMMAVLALSVDVGYLFALKAELKRSADAAALAGAAALYDQTQMQTELYEYEYTVIHPNLRRPVSRVRNSRAATPRERKHYSLTPTLATCPMAKSLSGVGPPTNRPH